MVRRPRLFGLLLVGVAAQTWANGAAWDWWGGAALAVTVAIVLAYRGFARGGPPAERAYRDVVAPAVARS